jgi:prepilin-type N-terminal cleavage/methylation domain-containing protein
VANKSIKKAFTIVELAIVLVVIGIILSMAVKGRELVRVAKIKADIVKIEKMRTALYMMYAKRNGQLPDIVTADKVRPGATGTTAEFVDHNQLIAEGMIGPHDMFSDVVNQQWLMRLCGIDSAGPFHYTYEQAKTAEGSGKSFEYSTCAYLQTPLNAAGNAALGLDAEVWCYYEHALDDDNFTTGDGKFWSHSLNTISPTPTPENFANCTSMPKQKVVWMFKLL